MPKKVMPSESAVIVNYTVESFDGKFYVAQEHFDALYDKHLKAKDTINYLLDKWFLSIENRMRDQDRVMQATSRHERTANKVSALEKEIRMLNKTIAELKMELATSPAPSLYRQVWAGHQVCRNKDFDKKAFDLKFGKTEPAFADPEETSKIIHDNLINRFEPK